MFDNTEMLLLIMGKKAAAPVPLYNWWLAAGMSADKCAVAYQPYQSPGASTVNLANPGTYTAKPIIPPGWTMTEGWKFLASPHSVIDTGLSVGANDSIVVAITNGDVSAGVYPSIVGASNASNGNPKMQIANNNNGASRRYINGATNATPGSAVDSGVFVIAGNKAYYNGVDEGVDLGAWSGTDNYSVYIGDSNSGGTVRGAYFIGNVKAYAHYKNYVLSQAEVTAITNAINAIPTVTNVPGTYNILDFGAVGDDTVDCTGAFSRANTFINACGGGTLYVPTGSYKISSNNVTWKSNVSMRGDGIGSSIIRLYSSFCLKHAGSSSDVLTDCSFTDFEIDGSQQNQNQTYSKGFYFVYGLRLNFTRVKVHDTGATGFGNDMLVDCVYTDCEASGCGRLGTTSDAGRSGFGIGTGYYAIENTQLINCIATGNKRYGVFFEKQFDVGVGYLSTGMKVIGGSFNSNNWGVGDCGVDGMELSGIQANSNAVNGLIVNGPSLYGIAGINGNVHDSEFGLNGGAGHTPATPTGYVFTNNNEHDNGA